MQQHALTFENIPELKQAESLKDVVSALNSPKALNAYLKQGVLGLGESYIDGDWECPRLDKFMHQIFTMPGPDYGGALWPKFLLHVLKEKLIDAQAGLKAFRIGEEHYNLGNDLFKAMLDSSMSYTSGYWAKANGLAEAQEAKLDLICKKLNLKPGMHILDIGCGWGNFAHFAARNYGVAVTGLTVSSEQADEARKLCADLPVEILLQDYRTLTGKFDHIVSIEMVEAVGRKNLPTYFNKVSDLLKPGGHFLMQVISTETCSKYSNKRVDQFLLWILKNIFPDGYLPKASEIAGAGGSGLLVENWHSFGPDYDKTLMAWGDNFNSSWIELKNRYDERFKRRWNFYLYSCAALFRARLVHLYQITYTKH